MSTSRELEVVHSLAAPLFPERVAIEEDGYVWRDSEAEDVKLIADSLLDRLSQVTVLERGVVKYVGHDHRLHCEQVARGSYAYSKDVFRHHHPTTHEWVYVAALLHDLGKLGIAPELLDLERRYTTNEEVKEMSFHDQLGYALLKSELGRDGDLAKLVASRHHNLHAKRGDSRLKLRPTEVVVLERLMSRKPYFGIEEFQKTLAIIASVDALEATYQRDYVLAEHRPTRTGIRNWANENINLDRGQLSLPAKYRFSQALGRLAQKHLPNEIAS